MAWGAYLVWVLISPCDRWSHSLCLNSSPHPNEMWGESILKNLTCLLEKCKSSFSHKITVTLCFSHQVPLFRSECRNTTLRRGTEGPFLLGNYGGERTDIRGRSPLISKYHLQFYNLRPLSDQYVAQLVFPVLWDYTHKMLPQQEPQDCLWKVPQTSLHPGPPEGGCSQMC